MCEDAVPLIFYVFHKIAIRLFLEKINVDKVMPGKEIDKYPETSWNLDGR